MSVLMKNRFCYFSLLLKFLRKKFFMKILFAINVLNRKYFDNFSCINFI